MKIAVGSTNPVKIEAVKKAFTKVWPKKKWQVIGIIIPSKVSGQPMSDIESITGATNRAKGALKQVKADFGVGIEGGMQEIDGKWFTCGWVAIVDKKGEIALGSSIKMQVSEKVVKMLKSGRELGDIDDELFEVKNSRQSLGHFGFMTNGSLPRTDAYTQGVTSALARFINPKIFK